MATAAAIATGRCAPAEPVVGHRLGPGTADVVRDLPSLADLETSQVALAVATVNATRGHGNVRPGGRREDPIAYGQLGIFPRGPRRRLDKGELPVLTVHDQSVITRDDARPGVAERAALPFQLARLPVEAADLLPGDVDVAAVDHRSAHLRRILLLP